MKETQLIGSILGTAIGDAIGLPYKGLSRRRGVRLLGVPDRHRLLLGFGMVSDDTEHTCIVAQSLIASGGNLDKFQHQLAWRLRVWLLGLPAGVGFATLRAIVKLWIGISPNKSGVFSAGNGPAMRSAILGVAIDDLTQLRQAVQIASRLTHTDPKAEYGAFAIALAAQAACKTSIVSGDDFLAHLKSCLGDEAQELLELMHQAIDSINRRETTLEFAAILGLSKGVSGYVYHSVPIAIHAWLSHQQDYRSAIIATVECGGDTDSIAAMVGGILGASVGKEGIPVQWLQGLREPSRSVKWMGSLAKQLAESMQNGSVLKPVRLSIPVSSLRNIVFTFVVLAHGFRRLLPPY